MNIVTQAQDKIGRALYGWRIERLGRLDEEIQSTIYLERSLRVRVSVAQEFRDEDGPDYEDKDDIDFVREEHHDDVISRLLQLQGRRRNLLMKIEGSKYAN